MTLNDCPCSYSYQQIVKWMPWITYKNLLGNTIQIPYAIGETILGIFAIFIRDYVTLQWVMSAVCFIQVNIWKENIT